MKKILLSLIVLFSILSLNAQYRYCEPNYYPNYYPNQVTPRVNILPTIIGAIVGAAIINNANNNDYSRSRSRSIMRQHYYQNQIEIERLERQVEILKGQNYRRERGFLGLKRRNRKF
jgi:hypothetical protein